MTVSTQRLIIILIALNLVMGITFENSNSPTSFSITHAQTWVNYTDTRAVHLEGEQQVWGGAVTEDARQWEGTLTSTLAYSYEVLKLFTRAMNPFSISPSEYNHQIEQFVAYVVLVFRMFLWVLVILEIYMFIKNKKVT